MADVVHKVTAEYRKIVDTWFYIPPRSDRWFINPPVDHLALVPEKYWHVDAETLPIREKTPAEKAVVDQAALDNKNSNTEAVIKSRLATPIAPLLGLSTSVVIAGLQMTVSINTVVVDDVTNVAADPSLTKRVNVTYVYNETSDTFSIEVWEKTDGAYEDLDDDEELAGDLGEWETVAAGTVLTPV